MPSMMDCSRSVIGVTKLVEFLMQLVVADTKSYVGKLTILGQPPSTLRVTFQNHKKKVALPANPPQTPVHLSCHFLSLGTKDAISVTVHLCVCVCVCVCAYMRDNARMQTNTFGKE